MVSVIPHWWVVKKYKFILQVNLTPFPRWFGEYPIIRFPFPLSKWRKGRGATKIIEIANRSGDGYEVKLHVCRPFT